jgi:hypothetical protein
MGNSEAAHADGKRGCKWVITLCAVSMAVRLNMWLYLRVCVCVCACVPVLRGCVCG